MEKTHYRKAFNSPYLSSADIVEPTVLTIQKVVLEPDKTHKTKNLYNTAYFVEHEIRPGEKLKPMILNAGNCALLKEITGSYYLEDWHDFKVVVWVERNVKLGSEVVDGLRLRKYERQLLTPADEERWQRAKDYYLQHGNLDKVLERVDMSDEHQKQLIGECNGLLQRTAKQ